MQPTPTPESSWERLATVVLGSAGLPSEATLEYCGIDPDTPVDTIEDRLLDLNVETCPACGWWVESGTMQELGDGTIVCDECWEGRNDGTQR